MKRRPMLHALTALALLGLAPVQSNAQTLSLGDPAPKLSQGKYIKGEPVKAFEEGTVYVLEFWATWCGPCVAAIPHVTELQEKYADEGLVVIGQNVWEQDESKVQPFVDNMGDKMAYRVAMDDKSSNARGAMATDFLAAAGQNGIPCSFIIDRTGTIVWIGHPMTMEEPLQQVLAGTYDMDAAKKAMEVGQAFQQAMQTKVIPLLQGQKFEEADKALAEMAKQYESKARDIALTRFSVNLQAKKFDAAYGVLDEAWPMIKDDAPLMNMIALAIVKDPTFEGHRNYEMAHKAIEQANKLADGKDAGVMTTRAMVLNAMGEKDKAIESLETAKTLTDDANSLGAIEKLMGEIKGEQAE